MLLELTEVNNWSGFVSILGMFGMRGDSQVGVVQVLAASTDKLKEEEQ